MLAGAPGVGKTRLAREALAAAEQRGAMVRWTVATESARGIPLGAFAEWMRGIGGNPTQVLAQAGDALLAGARGTQVVLGVDDAHLLDDLSALLVQQLVLRGVATVVVTVRSGEPAPDSVTALWKDGYLDRLEVEPLSGAQTGVLLEAALGGPLDSAGAGRVWALTRGNALYLRQLVDGEREAGRLAAVDGLWRWSRGTVVSPGLADLVRARMGALGEPLREVVDLLAFGEPLGAVLLVRLTDAAAVEGAEARGLIQVERDGRRLNARLAHPLFGEVRRADTGLLRARRLRGRIALELGETGARRAEDPLRRAVFALESDLPADPPLLTAAGSHALELLDLALAARLTRAAVAAGGGFHAQRILSCVLSWLSLGEEAEVELARLAPLAADDSQRALAVLPRAANLYWTLGRPAEAEATLDAVEATLTEPDALLVLTAVRAAFHAGLGRPAQAVEAGRAALAGPSLPDPAVALANWGLALGLGMLGRTDEIARFATRGYLATTRSFEAAILRFGLSDHHMDALRLAGYLDEAERIARARHAESASVPGPIQLFSVGLLGRVALAKGQLNTAVRLLRDARVGLAAFDTNGWLFRCLLSLTQALAMTGDAEAARRCLAELEAHRHPGFVFLEPEILLVRAWVRAAEGMPSRALTLIHDAARTSREQGQPAHVSLALHTAVRLGDRTVAVEAAELAARLDGPLPGAAAAHAAALAADDGDALHAASVLLEDLGDLLAAADAGAQAVAAHQRHQRRSLAHAAAVRTQRLIEACPGARTPALLAAVLPLPLTEREREVVTLAAQGMTSRQIAARLVVSVRTVEGHLYRASAKLGVTRRTDLAALLRGE